MLDNIEPRERPAEGRDVARRHETNETSVSIPTIADREVPLRTRRTPAEVHAWLDGELPEAAVAGSELVRDVEFWRRIDKEVETFRQVRAPVDVQAQIMEALPMATPRMTTPWWRRSFAMTPATALVAGAGLVALGVALGARAR